MDNIYDALDEIADKKTIDSKDLKFLLSLTQNNDSQIRAYVAELLVLSEDKKAEQALIDMCDDKDETVRVNACDSLCVFPSERTYNHLVECVLNDNSMLVKTYAVLSIADVLKYIEIDKKRLKKLLISNLNKEIHIRAACYKCLYILGDDTQLQKIIELLNVDNYQHRCTVLNILDDIISDNNKEYILNAVQKLKKTEKSFAVNSVIDRIIKKYG